MRRIRRCRGVWGMAVCVALLAGGGCYEKALVAPPKKPAAVSSAPVEVRDVQLYGLFTGRTDADAVNIVPRIRGSIEKIHFFPGDIVEAGDVLYEIEKFDYENDLETARANYDIAAAQAAKTKADYDRELGLKERGEGFTTQADLDRTKALWDEAQAKVMSAEASVSEAQKEVDRCTIKAPKRGKINRTLYEVGNFVDGSSANPPTLTTLMPMDPIYVYCEVTDATFDEINKRILEKIREKLGDQFNSSAPYDNDTITKLARDNGLEEVITFEMGLISDTLDGKPQYPYRGVINYNENKVDRTTGTITIRGEIKNPNYLIYPGYICNVRIPGSEVPGAVLIQERAICYDLSDVYVWVVDNGKASKRLITLGPQLDDSMRIVTSGLDGSETYIIDGTQNVVEGGEVTQINDSAEPAPQSPQSALSAAPTAENGPTVEQAALSTAPTAEAPAQSAETAKSQVPAASLGAPVSETPAQSR